MKYNCTQCGESFITYNKNPKYCSKQCEGQGKSGTKETRTCPICKIKFTTLATLTKKYCSVICRNKSYEQKYKTKCKQCGIVLYKTKTQLKVAQNNFCSTSCRGTYYIQRRKNTRRSKAETYLVEKIKTEFPNVKIETNTKKILKCKYEIDIWLPEYQLAIELNGPCHYINLYGDLKKVQQRDLTKQKEIEDRGFKLISINVNIPDYKKVYKIIDDEYETVIKQLLV